MDKNGTRRRTTTTTKVSTTRTKSSPFYILYFTFVISIQEEDERAPHIMFSSSGNEEEDRLTTPPSGVVPGSSGDDKWHCQDSIWARRRQLLATIEYYLTKSLPDYFLKSLHRCSVARNMLVTKVIDGTMTLEIKWSDSRRKRPRVAF